MFVDRFNLDVALAFLPAWCSNCASAHFDTIPKLINFLLVVMAVCNLFFLLGSLRMTMLPAMGFNVVVVSIMLCVQNAVVWSVLNNNGVASSAWRAMSPTDFMIGLSLGITIGASILTFVLSIYFHRLSKCKSTEEVVSAFACRHYGVVIALWFWGALLFWINTALAVLIALGKDDLMHPSHYEDIGLSMDEYEDHFRRYNTQYQQTQQHVHASEVYEDVGDAPLTHPRQIPVTP